MEGAQSPLRGPRPIVKRDSQRALCIPSNSLWGLGVSRGPSALESCFDRLHLAQGAFKALH